MKYGESEWDRRKRREEKEAMVRGMKRAGKQWALRADHKKFHPLLIHKARELYNEGILFFDEVEESNQRKAHCKICGDELQKGQGIRMLIYASNFYNLSFYYSCECCRVNLLQE